MAKNRTLNEIRQSKEYQIAKNIQANSTHKMSFSTAQAIADQQALNRKIQGGDFIKPTTKPAKSTAEVMSKNPFEHAEVDKTVDQIVERLDTEIYDVLFQAINDEMTKHYVFDSSEYLTEAGLELFEDEWFEFYHENHGRIMHKLLQNLK